MVIASAACLIVFFSLISAQGTDFEPVVAPAPSWSALFKRSQGWTGADGIFAIPLSGHEGPGRADETKTLFVFSDTFIGSVDSASGARQDAVMVNNSLALLEGGTPDADNIRFIWGSGEGGAPASAFIPQTPNTVNKTGVWYWLQDGFCHGGNVYIFPMIVEHNPDGPPGFQFHETDIGLIKIPLGNDGEPDLAAHSQMDAPLFWNQGDRTVYFGCGVMPNTQEAGAYSPDGFLYVYGRIHPPGEEIKLGVARVLANDVEDFSQWRFWDGSGWSPDIGSTASLGRGGPELSVTPVSSGPLQGKYLMVSMQLERDLFMRIGDSPEGPFGPRINIYHTVEPDAGQGIYTYNAKAHPSLSTEGQWLISYNVNTTDWDTNLADADIYRPRFLYLRLDGATGLNRKGGPVLLNCQVPPLSGFILRWYEEEGGSEFQRKGYRIDGRFTNVFFKGILAGSP
jgi:hypothetical protein